ncbi:MAG: glycosyl hydrolase [Bryobacteraceae bacterium]
MRRLLPFVIVAFCCLPAPAQPAPDPLHEVRWRSIGPFRGGRAVAVAGIPSLPQTYYFGATGGGIWKTTDGGFNWLPVSDGQVATGSVGALAVSESDPNIVYAGMGEACIRGNASPGDGVYKSTDAGRTWKHIGLEQTQQIGAVVVNPRNPNIVFVAALGHQFASNEERGVYRSTDGGATWKQVLTRGPKAGAVDIVMDPNNSNVLYAAFWEVYRTPYSLESGGPGSGIWKSTDGGETWKDLSHSTGMPRGIFGKIGITVSGANSDRVWAIVEAEEGGVYRSDNGGTSWTRVNKDRDLRQRAWYYTHIYADPKNADEVYVLNTGVYRSNDGGRTYTAIPTPHGDNHDLWIDPNNPDRMIEANDGGVNASINGGRTWSPENNQPTAQFYRVALDNDFPYHAYGAQQDNSTVRTATRGRGGITERDWYDVGGGESGWIAPDPRDSNVVYAGSYGNLITRFDAFTGVQRDINPWPDNPMGHPAADLKYRFQWSFPIIISPHDPKVIYAGANVMFRSTDEGQSWEPISKDLTRDDKTRQGSSGGPLTKDNTSIEYYCTIFTINESTITKGLIWVGSDDGLVNLTRDGGKTWTNVTPPKDILPEWSQINAIEPSPFDPATAYVAATKYKSDDFSPYLYKTSDYGKTWTKIVTGIPANHFTRVVREDLKQKGLLFAGTEFGIYVSYDDGAHWKSIQLNLPVVPITDLAFHKRDDELVVATQGRSFWIMDDLPLLRELKGATLTEDVRLFAPKETLRAEGGGRGPRGFIPVGANPPTGAVIDFWLKDKPTGEVKIEILDSSGKPVNHYSSNLPNHPAGSDDTTPAIDEQGGGGRGGFGAPARIHAQAGMNRFIWDLHYPDATTFPGLIMWAGSTRGPMIVPGTYTAKLTVGDKTQTQQFVVKSDPRLKTTAAEFSAQLSLSLQLRDKLSQVNQAVVDIRAAKKQLEDYAARLKDDAAAKKVADAARDLDKRLTAVEEELYQVKNQSSQDPLNFPIKLNNRIAALLGVVQDTDAGPTKQSNVVYEGLASEANAQLRAADKLLKDDVAQFNKLVKDSNIPAVTIPPRKDN